MQGTRRRIVYITLYEGIAIVCASAGLAWMSDRALVTAGPLGAATSLIAVAWSLAFNALFERWEARQTVRGRSVMRRVVHAIGFEGGMAVMQVPLIAWWLGIGLASALLMDLGLLVFFLFYTFVFNWLFDLAFGLPNAAALKRP